MSEHYYTKKPQTELKTEQITVTLRDEKFVFITGSGVFSKKAIDFGSQLLIESFVAPELAGDYLDLGCGYGPIGITLAKESSDRIVYMVDVNERALELAQKNAISNQVRNVTIMESSGFTNLEKRTFAAIVTNPPIRAGKTVINQFFSGSYQHLERNGELWVVVQKKQGAPSVMKFLEELFGNVTVVKKKKGYYILRSVKR